MRQMILILVLLMAAGIMGAACGDDSTTTGPTPLPTYPPPELLSSDVQINSVGFMYHYIGWKFTVKSPKTYSLSVVEIRWYDVNGLQIAMGTWIGQLTRGTYTYSEETMVLKDVWARVVRREVEITSWM